MFKNLKSWYDRKVYIISYLYNVYRHLSDTEKTIQAHAKKISKSTEYEKTRYGRVLEYDGRRFDKDGNPVEGFAGVILRDWPTKSVQAKWEEITEEDKKVVLDLWFNKNVNKGE